jgi:hypothetical protein
MLFTVLASREKLMLIPKANANSFPLNHKDTTTL